MADFKNVGSFNADTQSEGGDERPISREEHAAYSRMYPSLKDSLPPTVSRMSPREQPTQRSQEPQRRQAAASERSQDAGGTADAEAAYPKMTQDRANEQQVNAARADAMKQLQRENGGGEAEERGEPPESYEVLQVDGLGQQFVQDASKVFRDLGVDDKGAEQLAHVEARHRREYWQSQQEQWRQEAENDAELQEQLPEVRRLVKEFGDPGLVKELGPYANHPGVARMLGRIARRLRDLEY